MSPSTFMARALTLARRAQGRSNPNPPVGAVVVVDGSIVGEGRTQAAGEAHAEIEALRRTGLAARGAALYVTLEPCSHYGRTAPCTEAILAAGVTEVHIAVPDPSPTAGGGGAELEGAGVRVVWSDGAEQAAPLYRAHGKHATTGVPWVVAKFAASLDGKIATANRESRWITGPQAREEAHRLRSQVDAVAVGAGTVLADDPLLTARPSGRPWPRQPLRVVVGGAERLSPEAKIFNAAGPALLAAGTHVTAAALRRLQDHGIETLLLPQRAGKVDLVALLRALAERSVVSVLVEGGSELLGSLFDQQLVDEVCVFLAPLIIGGVEAVPAVGGRGVGAIVDVLRLHNVTVRRLGRDLLVRGLVPKE